MKSYIIPYFKNDNQKICVRLYINESELQKRTFCRKGLFFKNENMFEFICILIEFIETDQYCKTNKLR